MEKMGSFVWFLCFLMVLQLSKNCIFCSFVLTSAKNLSLLNQFTYMHLKGLAMHFQKMVLFIVSPARSRDIKMPLSLPLRLEGVETLKYRCVCRPSFGKVEYSK